MMKMLTTKAILELSSTVLPFVTRGKGGGRRCLR
jgi:hypothetical protein